MTNKSDSLNFPLKEMLKSIPGVFGIRLEEEPGFEVLTHEGSIEVRKYGKTLLAQVSIAGDHQHAVDEGFNKLAKYIFGGNRDEEAMAMTTPVFQEQPGGSKAKWIISFVMPREFDLQSVPKPVDSQIKLVELPARKVAVRKFSGNNNRESMMKAETELRAWLASSTYKATDEVRFAQYDQPFAVPFLKRNEVQIVVN